MFNPAKQKDLDHKKRQEQLLKEGVKRISDQLKEKILNRWQILVKPEDLYIMATEVTCADPGCVPIETLLVLTLDEHKYKNVIQPYKWATKILKPVNEVNNRDIEDIELPFEVVIDDPSVRVELEAVRTFVHGATKKLDGGHERKLHIFALAESLEKQAIELRRLASTDLETKKEIQAMNAEKYDLDDENITKVSMGPINQGFSTTTKIINNNLTDRQIGDHSFNVNSTMHQNSLSALISSTDGIEDISKKASQRSSNFEGDKNNFIDVSNSESRQSALQPRHEKEVKRRGCPCCDPDNIDLLVDKLIFMELPPN